MIRVTAVGAASLALLGLCSVAGAQLKTPDVQGSLDQVAPFIEIMEKYLYLVDHMARLADNPTASGIAAVMRAGDVFKEHPQDAIEYFNKVLPDVKNDSVRRAIRIQLADLYQKTNQQDKALEQLRELMVFAPASPRPPRAARATSPPRSERGEAEQ